MDSVDDGVVDPGDLTQLRFGHLSQVGRQRTHGSGGCHIHLYRLAADFDLVDQSEIGDGQSEFRIDDLGERVPSGQFAFTHRECVVHTPEGIGNRPLSVGGTMSRAGILIV